MKLEMIDSRLVNVDIPLRDFKFYIFDWDDNILHMPTRVYLEKLMPDGEWKSVAIPTSTFALIRTDTKNYRFPSQGGAAAAYRDFTDSTPEVEKSAFIHDTKVALQRVLQGEKPGPSFETLRNTLREGRLFAVVTARGHAPATIREALKIFIETILTKEEKEEMMQNLRGYRWWLDKMTKFGSDEEELDYYLTMCRYHAVTNPDFKRMLANDADFSLRITEASNAHQPELAKEFAVKDFVEHLFHILERTGGLGKSVSIGFSDDDVGNVQAVAEYITEELSRKFEGFKFVVYDTSDPTLSNGRKVVVVEE